MPVADAFHLSLRDLMRDKVRWLLQGGQGHERPRPHPLRMLPLSLQMDHSRAWGTAMMGGGYLIVVGFLVSVQNFFAA